MVLNLVNLFKERVTSNPDHAAIIGPGKGDIWSYADLQDHIEEAAAELRKAGVRAKHCIGIHLPSGRDYIVWTYAAWACGAIAVPIPVELTTEEKGSIGSDIVMEWVLTPEPQAGFISGEPHMLTSSLALIAVTPEKKHPEGFQHINAAFLRFTSGTTGAAKGVILSHETIHERICAANEVLRIGPDDRIMWLLSMSYHFAVSIVAYLSFGATIVLSASHFGKAIVQACAQHRATLIYASPMHYLMMAGDSSGTMLPDLRLAISTTTALDPEIAQMFSQRFRKGLSQAYGIIEIGLPCISWDRPLEKAGCVGRVLPAYRIRLEDIGYGEDMQRIAFKGPGLFDGYYEPWTPREEATENGWFITGDLGYTDADGYLYLCGRAKEVINVAGMKFFPQETETVLCTHPQISEACVVAHKDARLGEVPHAYITCTGTAADFPAQEALRAFCLQHLAAYKVPEQFFLVPSLVRTASGKIIRDEHKQSQQVDKQGLS